MSPQNMTEIIEKRNIIDFYHYWTNEAIKANLDTKRHPFSIACLNFGIDFNIASTIRSSNCFMAEKVYIVGRKKWDKRGAVGTFNYMDLKHVKDVDELPSGNWVAVDNVEGAEAIDTFQWPANPLIIFGQECGGIPQHILQRAQHKVYIRQYGSVRSLNVACSSSIVMQDWCRKYYAGR